MKILAAIHDLMFSSKVNAAAQGRPIVWMPRGTRVAEQVEAVKPDVLLIDLAAPALDAVNAIRQIKAAGNAVTIIGYVDHTRAEVMEAARTAGCDQVLSKGEFARRLPELLAGI